MCLMKTVVEDRVGLLLLTEGRLVVVGKGRVVQLVGRGEPPLGAHGVWVVEVVGVAVGCVLEDGGESLSRRNHMVSNWSLWKRETDYLVRNSHDLLPWGYARPRARLRG